MLGVPFGKTGKIISRLGFGGMRFEQPFDTDAMAEIVLHAFNQGITYFDTAPGYCDDQSELIFGRAIPQMKKTGRPFYISSKTFAAEPSAIRRQCETSLKRLNVDAIDFYHVWCLIMPGELAERKRKGALKAFQKLKEEGLIRHISVSTHLEYQYVGDMLDEGEGLFESMLIGINLQNYPLRCAGVQAAADRGIAVVTMNTLAGGILTQHADRFAFALRPGDRSIVEAALRFNLSIPGVTVALIGMRNKQDVDEAVAAIKAFEPLEHSEIEAVSKKAQKEYQNLCTQCGYCKDCPAGIPVVRLMESYNISMLKGMDAALSHMRYHWDTPDIKEVLAPCTQCHYCEETCTQQLPILERFEELRAAYQSRRKSS